MHIVVLTKSVPDTEAAVTVDSSGGIRAGDKLVINPWDEYAITEAILIKEKHKVKVTVMTVGTEPHNEALKHGLAIGCDQAFRLWDKTLENHDSLVYAKVVAAAVQKLGDVNLLLFGRELPDIASDAHIFQTARKLNWNLVGFVSKIEALNFSTKAIRVQRQAEQGTEVVSSRLPAVISVLKGINEPKYPTFIGIRKAAKAEIPVWGLADLGLTSVQSKAQVTSYQELPRREGTVEMIDGVTAQEKAAKLVEKLLAEKVL